MKKEVKISLIIVGILAIIIVFFIIWRNSITGTGPLINDFKTCEKAGGIITESYPRQCTIDRRIAYVEGNDNAAPYCGQANVAEVNVCGNYIAVTSSLLGGGITYYKTDGASFSCPVVGPDSMSPECKGIYEKKLAENFDCVKVC